MKIWLLTISELFVIIASTLLLFLATDFGNSFAMHIFSTNLIKENSGSQAVTGTCSHWNLQPSNLKGRRFKSGCWHTIWAGVPLMLRKLKISLASRTMLRSVLIFGKMKPIAWLTCSRSKFGIYTCMEFGWLPVSPITIHVQYTEYSWMWF